MAVERAPGGTSLIDVLDRVLDKGIVIDAWVRVSLVGIDLVTVEARVVVASIDTYLKYSEAVGITGPVSRPREIQKPGEFERMQREVCTDFRGAHLVPGAGHWVQQEQPGRTAEMLRARDVKASRIARGVPLGGELEYVDAGTISQALLDRRGI